jgi:putative oxidoreductase
MPVSRAIARPLLAGIFIYSGFDVAKNPGSRKDIAERVVTPVARSLGLEISAVDAVRANAIGQVIGGALLAFGVAPRLAATVLAGSMTPTTLAGHRFWEERDPKSRHVQLVQFLKNAGLLGGLILAMFDTEGEPSVAWRARRATERMEERIQALPLHRRES